MPTLTPVSPGGYNDAVLAECLRYAGRVERLDETIGARIVGWLKGGGQRAVSVHATFAGAGRNESSLLAHDAVASLVLSDASSAACTALRTTLASTRDAAAKCRVEQLAFPLASVPPCFGSAFDAVTCLGASLFHVRSRQDRLTCLRQFRKMLKPGGHVFIDNKNWEPGLVEARDPVTIYALPPDERGERFLAVTYEYPRPGSQVLHAQLITAASPGGVEGKAYKTEHRWAIEGYPFLTTSLVAELVAVGFEDVQVVDEDCWPRHHGDGAAAYYQLAIARRPL